MKWLKSFCKLGSEDNTWFLRAVSDFNFLCLYSYLYANSKKPYCGPRGWLCGGTLAAEESGLSSIPTLTQKLSMVIYA